MVSYALRDFGSYTVAGRVHTVETGEPREVNFTRSAVHMVDPRGEFAVEHAYVQYFLPERRNGAPPVVLVHGGGMCGSTWETTPDGRPGWINLLVQRGYDVHVLDNVERGRSGFAPGLWPGDPLPRSRQEAWLLFRIGAADDFDARRPHPGSLFPIDDFDRFARMLVPRWLSTTPLQVEALVAVLRKIGPAIVICHSQGGEITHDAMSRVPELFTGLIAVEPSARLEDAQAAAGIPTVLAAGDFLDADMWQERQHNWRAWVTTVAERGGQATLLEAGNGLAAGHSHLPMLDQGSEACLDACVEALGAVRSPAQTDRRSG